MLRAKARFPARVPAWAGLWVFVFAAPFFVTSVGLNSILDVAVLAVAVMSVNFLTGMAGQVTLTNGAFLGFGAYSTAVLMADHGWSYWMTLPATVLLSGLLGALIGLPALRLTGLQLALVTLGLALAFPTLVLRAGERVGGSTGLSVGGVRSPQWFPFTDEVWVYWLMTLALALVWLISSRLRRGGVGRVLLTVKENPLLASAMGVDVRGVKVATFAASGALAGVAGWMYTMHREFVSPLDFGFFLSLNLLLAMMIGGAGTLAGPLLGAAILRFSPDVSADVGVDPLLAPAVTGLIVIVVLRYFPSGIAGFKFSARRTPSDV